MSGIDSVSRAANYQMTATDYTIKKIANNPSAAKKVLQIVEKVFAAFDLYMVGQVQKRVLTGVMNDTSGLIDFYSSYKNMMFWVNLFSKDTLDQDALIKSLKSSLCASHKDEEDKRAQEIIALAVFDDVMEQNAYHSKSEVFDTIKKSLVDDHDYQPEQAEQIVEQIIVQQKARPVAQVISMVFLTVAEFGGNLMMLKKWQVLDLSNIAAKIGSQSRVFMFVVDLGMDTTVGMIKCAGLTLAVGNSTYHSINQGIKIYRTTNIKEKAKIHKELRNTLLDLLSAGVDLAATAAPLAFKLNPPALIAISLISKGTGLVCILAR